MDSSQVDLKLEVVVIPVADVDRAKEFYEGLGWRLDADFPFDNGFRVVQFTPPGSGCSLQFGTSMTTAAPSRPSSRSLRPVVISTGSPTSLSGMRWRAVSAWIAVIPGMTS